MKFGKQFSDYQIKSENCVAPGTTYVDFKKLKKLLKRCRMNEVNDRNSQCISTYSEQEFREVLNKNLDSIVNFFSIRARKLVRIHLASKGRKLFHYLAGKSMSNKRLFVEGKCLMDYIFMNHLAFCKIMKKYTKIFKSSSNQEMKKALCEMHQKLLHCPFLFELHALLINLEKKMNSFLSSTPLLPLPPPSIPLSPLSYPSTSFSTAPSCLYHPYSFDQGLVTSSPSPSPSSSFLSSCNDACSLSLITKKDYSLPLPQDEVDFNCPICLELLFDPVSLGCGHMMCHSCACTAGNVSSNLVINLASGCAKCPVCRQSGVFQSLVRLPEINLLIKSKYPECWREREKMEKEKEIERVKAFWANEMASAFSHYGVRV